jgi:hypothetical protein
MAPSIMKSFKVLALLSLAATLSCGFPTNVTQATDGGIRADSFIKVIKRNTQAKDLLVKTYIDPIINAAIVASHKKVCAEFDLFPYDCILHIRVQNLPKFSSRECGITITISTMLFAAPSMALILMG